MLGKGVALLLPEVKQAHPWTPGNLKVIENFKYLLELLCSAIDTVKSKLAESLNLSTCTPMLDQIRMVLTHQLGQVSHPHKAASYKQTHDLGGLVSSKSSTTMFSQIHMAEWMLP